MFNDFCFFVGVQKCNSGVGVRRFFGFVFCLFESRHVTAVFEFCYFCDLCFFMYVIVVFKVQKCNSGIGVRRFLWFPFFLSKSINVTARLEVRRNLRICVFSKSRNVTAMLEVRWFLRIFVFKVAATATATAAAEKNPVPARPHPITQAYHIPFGSPLTPKRWKEKGGMIKKWNSQNQVPHSGKSLHILWHRFYNI